MVYAVLLVLFLAPATDLGAQGKKPENKPARNEALTLQQVKDGANDVLDDVEQGVRKAAKGAKKAGNKALTAVDEGVHKLIRDDKK